MLKLISGRALSITWPSRTDPGSIAFDTVAPANSAPLHHLYRPLVHELGARPGPDAPPLAIPVDAFGRHVAALVEIVVFDGPIPFATALALGVPYQAIATVTATPSEAPDLFDLQISVTQDTLTVALTAAGAAVHVRLPLVGTLFQ